jgi:hypothetical protein
VTSVSVSTSAAPNGHIDDQDRVLLATLEKDSYLLERAARHNDQRLHLYCDKANEGPRKSDGAVGDTAYSQHA